MASLWEGLEDLSREEPDPVIEMEQETESNEILEDVEMIEILPIPIMKQNSETVQEPVKQIPVIQQIDTANLEKLIDQKMDLIRAEIQAEMRKLDLQLKAVDQREAVSMRGIAIAQESMKALAKKLGTAVIEKIQKEQAQKEKFNNLVMAGIAICITLSIANLIF